jgi:hypothetical protein
VLLNLTYFSFSTTGFSRLKMSYKKKNQWTFFRTQQEFSTVINHVSIFPKDCKILSLQRGKNVYEVDMGLASASITAMFAFSASGIMCPSMLKHPYERIPSEITL